MRRAPIWRRLGVSFPGEGVTIARHRPASLLLVLAALLITAALAVAPAPVPARAQGGTVPAGLLTPYEVVGSTPHDPNAFLQGLVWHDGGFYESTGLNGQSTLRRVAYPSGEVLQKIDVPREYFAEGLAMVDNRLLQLTWRGKKAFVYDRESFGLLAELPYATEGWGLTFDGASLILSDGSDTLFFLDPTTFEVVRTLPVTLDGRPLAKLNELEWIKGEVWSNVWMTDLIVRIDPATGQVVGVLDLAGILQTPRGDNDDVLNGIAYDAEGDRTFVSGKRWPLIFEIRVTQ